MGSSSASTSDSAAASSVATTTFAGVFLALRRRGPDTAILLRNTLAKTPVEVWFKIYSPAVRGIEIVWRRPKRARRAKLTYMRKPKHDMGDVHHLVELWQRSRKVFSKAGGADVGANGTQGRARGKR